MSPKAKRLLLSCSLVALLSVISYWRILDDYFLYDDAVFVREASQAGLLDFVKVFAIDDFTGVEGNGEFGFYRPLNRLTLYFEYLLWGTHPVGYHVTNVLLHILCSCLALLIAERLCSKSAGLACGLLFAVHPLHVEAVAWIGARADLLCCLFLLCGLYLHVEGGRRRDRRQPLLVGLAFAMALCSKELAISFPAVLFTYDLLHRRRHHLKRRYFVVTYLILAATTGLYLAVRYWVLGTLVGGYRDFSHLAWRPEELTVVLPASLRTLLIPVNQEVLPATVTAVTIWVTVAALLGLLLRWLSSGDWDRSAKLVVVALGWIAFCLVPMNRVWTIRWDLCNSRSWYLVSFGLCLLVGVLFGSLQPGRRWRVPLEYVILAAAVLCYSWLTMRNCETWSKAARWTRKVQEGLLEVAGGLPEQRPLLFLDPPSCDAGALLYSGWVRVLTEPPFAPKAIPMAAVRTREAHTLLPSDARLTSFLYLFPLLAQRGPFAIAAWDRHKEEVTLISRAWAGGAREPGRAGDAVASAGPTVGLGSALRPEPEQVLTLRAQPSSSRYSQGEGDGLGRISWTGDGGRARTYSFPLASGQDSCVYHVPVGLIPGWLGLRAIRSWEADLSGGGARVAEMAVRSRGPFDRDHITTPQEEVALSGGQPGQSWVFAFHTSLEFETCRINFSLEEPWSGLRVWNVLCSRDALVRSANGTYSWRPSPRYRAAARAGLRKLAGPRSEVKICWWVEIGQDYGNPFLSRYVSPPAFFYVRDL